MANVEESYNYCKKLAKNNYENFPLVLLGMNKNIQQSIYAIYAFARLADDIADEGNYDSGYRISKLNELSNLLIDIESNNVIEDNKIFIALQDTLQKNNLDIQYLHALLKAFKQDTVKNSYSTFNEVVNYCQYSANPIGRLLLQLNNQYNIDNITASDCLCTALQLINFLQDVLHDLEDRNRSYLPINELMANDINLEDILQRKKHNNYRVVISLQIKRIKSLLANSEHLAFSINGLFALYLKTVQSCAWKLVSLLESRNNYYSRPILSKLQLFKCFCSSFFKR